MAGGVHTGTEAGERETALWTALRGEGCPAARERLFAGHLPFARGIAARHYRRGGAGIELADLQQLACEGLLQAIDRFDPGRGVPFRGYAARRITGSILSGIAKMSEVREQVSYRAQMRRERMRSLAAAEGRESDDALAALRDLAMGLAIGFMLEGTALYVDGTAVSPANAYEGTAWKDMVGRLMRELEALPERERSIVRHHYLGGVGFTEIAAAMGLSKGRVSQLHKSAVTLLRKRLAQERFSMER